MNRARYEPLTAIACLFGRNVILSMYGCCRVYKRLESIPTTHDEQEEKVAAELADLLGPERMPWLQLVHQLIVCEEVMQAEQ